MTMSAMRSVFSSLLLLLYVFSRTSSSAETTATATATAATTTAEDFNAWSVLVLEEAEKLLLYADYGPLTDTIQTEDGANEEKLRGDREKYLSSLTPFDVEVTPAAAASGTPVCLYDSLGIHWRIKDSIKHEDDFFHAALAISSPSNPSHVIVTSLAAMYQPPPSSSSSSSSSGEEQLRIHPVQYLKDKGRILCASEDLFCRVNTGGIHLSPEDNTLLVEFDQPTNTPHLESLEDIANALDISPPLTESCEIAWISSQRLKLTLHPTDIERILKAYYAKETVRVLLPALDMSVLPGVEGRKTFRLMEHGDISVFILNKLTKRRMSAIQSLHVQHCANSDPLPSTQLSSRYHHSVSQLPVFHMKGIFAVTGNDAIRLSHEAVPTMAKGSWTLSFWMRLLELPSGNYRSLFYKSDPNDANQRTPSAWMMPTSNHITVRLSTVENVDTGITTNQEIPINEWTHVAFVFQNQSYSLEEERLKAWNPEKEEEMLLKEAIRLLKPTPAFKHRQSSSTSGSNAAKGYKLSVYFNGKLDIVAEFLNEVIPNTGTLMMFKDSSFMGPKSFISNLQLHQTVLNAADISSMYLEGVSGKDAVALDHTLQVLESSDNILLPYRRLCQDKAMYASMKTLYSRDYCQELTHSTTSGSNTEGEIMIQDPSGGNNQVADNVVPLIPQSVIDMIVKKSQESISNCEDYEARLAMHLESAEVGSVVGIYNWARLLMYGYEIPDSKCGFSVSKSISKRKKKGNHVSIDKAISDQMSIEEMSHPELFADMARAVYGFTLSVERGIVDALVPLSIAMYSGVGLDTLVHYNRSLAEDWEIPTSLYSTDMSIRKDRFRTTIGQYLEAGLEQCSAQSNQDTTSKLFPNSVLCDVYYKRPFTTTTKNRVDQKADPSNLALGLLFIAALHGNVDAQVALAYKYEHGIGGASKDVETAAHYLVRPVQVASDVFHTVGAQPIVEADRVNDYTVADIGKGQQGNDDEMIQYQMVRAKEGDVPSMLAMGDLYYYGARGLPRDHPQALQYYQQAASTGDASGMCGVANMYLKGEGTDKNISHAIELYEVAANNGSIRAYNGLGYIYFYGIPGDIEKNDTLAFQYFLLAAEFETDGDACFNAAYCLENGIGVKADLSRAIHFYEIAAKKTGHFDSVKTLGLMTLEGRGLPRNSQNAMVYLNAAKSIGPWMGWLRRGFDLFLTASSSSHGGISGDPSIFMRSLFCYLYSGELGYEVAQSNAGYILRSKLIPQLNLPAISMSRSTHVATPSTEKEVVYDPSQMLQRLLLREYSLGAYIHGYIESFFYLGNCYFTGRCGLLYRDAHVAKHYYHGASVAKHGLASAYLGVMYHFNVGLRPNAELSTEENSSRHLLRALQHYDDALSTPMIQDSLQLRTIVNVLRQMCSWKLSSATSSSSYYTALLKPLDYSLDYVVKMLWNM